MPTPKIAVIAGDGIGPEVIHEAIRVTDAALEITQDTEIAWHCFPWGSEYYLQHGCMIPEGGMAQLARCDAILLGAIGHPSVQDHRTLNGLLLPIRRQFDQFINLRPSRLYEGVESPLRQKRPGEIDIVVFRENTEGEYADVGGRLYRESEHEVAIQTSVFTRFGTERIIRAAFEYALGRRKHVTSITKSNAQGHSMVFWDDVFAEVASEFPDVETRSLLIDAAAMQLLFHPESFDVVVASNLFGDILTEITAAIVGSIGLAASANLNPARTAPSMFEPVHGSAPDIAGKGLANPLAAILAAGMLLEHLNFQSSTRLLQGAVASVLRRGKVLPSDLGGSASTEQVGRAVVEALTSP